MTTIQMNVWIDLATVIPNPGLATLEGNFLSVMEE